MSGIHASGQDIPRRVSAPAGWSPDLGRRIGSARWFGELALLTGLIALALAFWPGSSARIESKPFPVRRGEPSKPTAVRLAPPTAGDKISAEMSSTTTGDESLEALFQRAGASDDDAKTIDAIVAAALFPDGIAPGVTVSFRLGSEILPGGRRRLDRVDLRPRLDLAISVVRENERFASVRRAIPVETRTTRMQGRIGGDLGASIARAGGRGAVIHEFRQAISQQLDLDRDIAPDDSFDLVTTDRRAADGRTEAGEVLYAAVMRDEKPRAELLRWGRAGDFHMTGAIGQGAPGAKAIWPVYGRFTSGYGLRFHPVLGYPRMHAGIDIGAPWGAPIYAVASGVVTFAGYHGGHGNYVRLAQAHGDGNGYAHLSRIVVSPGQRVSSGQLIGYVGSTGLSTGPHLHFEVYRNGRSVDPMGAKALSGVVSQVDRDRFAAAVGALKALTPTRSR